MHAPVDFDSARASVEPSVALEDPRRKEREKFEQHKKLAQRLTLHLLEVGVEDGLSPAEAAILKDALLTLGWLPPDVRV